MWQSFKKWFWAMVGNSRTMLIGYLAVALGLLQEFNMVDWTPLLGDAGAAKASAIMGIVMIVLRLVTSGPVSFRTKD